jgi:hypothetical protein
MNWEPFMNNSLSRSGKGEFAFQASEVKFNFFGAYANSVCLHWSQIMSRIGWSGIQLWELYTEWSRCFRRFWNKQRVISNWLLIEDFLMISVIVWLCFEKDEDILLVSAITGFLCGLVKVFQQMWEKWRFSIMERSFRPAVHPTCPTFASILWWRHMFNFTIHLRAFPQYRWLFTIFSSHFTFMLQFLGSQQGIGYSDSTKFCEHRLVLRGDSIDIATLCELDSVEILRVWIHDSIIILNFDRPSDQFDFMKEHISLKSMRFEWNSRLTGVELEAFSYLSFQWILIPSKGEILGWWCFSSCISPSSITFESNSSLTRVESRLVSDLSLQSIFISTSVERLGSKCFHDCESLSSMIFKSNSYLARIESERSSFSSLQLILIRSNGAIVGSDFFSGCKSLSSITFESSSRLTRIELGAFSH